MWLTISYFTLSDPFPAYGTAKLLASGTVSNLLEEIYILRYDVFMMFMAM